MQLFVSPLCVQGHYSCLIFPWSQSLDSTTMLWWTRLVGQGSPAWPSSVCKRVMRAGIMDRGHGVRAGDNMRICLQGKERNFSFSWTHFGMTPTCSSQHCTPMEETWGRYVHLLQRAFALVLTDYFIDQLYPLSLSQFVVALGGFGQTGPPSLCWRGKLPQ